MRDSRCSSAADQLAEQLHEPPARWARHRLAPSSLSIACFKSAGASAPESRRPFTKKVGVELTPSAAASCTSASTAPCAFLPSTHSWNLATSRPASLAMSPALSFRFSLVMSLCFEKSPLYIAQNLSLPCWKAHSEARAASPAHGWMEVSGKFLNTKRTLSP